MFYLNYIATIAVCIGGIIVGNLALRRHETAAWLSIVGWSLLLITNCWWLFLSPSFFGGMVAWGTQVSAYVCIFLGIYLLSKKTTSQKKFFTFKYDGLDLRTEKEHS